MTLDYYVLWGLLGVAMALWLGTLSYIAGQHMRQDDVRHNNRKEEVLRLYDYTERTVAETVRRLEKHDANQNGFRTVVEKRLAQIEARLDVLIQGETKRAGIARK